MQQQPYHALLVRGVQYAGVVGLAVAKALAESGRKVVILEAADAIGTETSSRNSEVVHAGRQYAVASPSISERTCAKPPVVCMHASNAACMTSA